ncbi:MAG TPA: cytidine deaminase [Patescibacteria group bacterium]
MVNEEQIQQLIQKAKEVGKHAFVPKSGHAFGASVLTQEGEIFEGCTVESIVSGLGTCAERAAVDHAVIHGKYVFSALAVVGDTITYPCGACLQYMAQFYQIAEKEILVIVADKKGKFRVHTLFELLPHAYFTSSQVGKIKEYKTKK